MEQLINNFSLTLPQQDIYFEQILYPNDAIYNIGAKIEIRGNINVDAFKDAYIHLINQHDAYRIIIDSNNGIPYFYILDVHDSDLECVDYSNESDAERISLEFMRNNFQMPFDLNKKVLLHKFILIKVHDDLFYLFSKYHHIITDGWGTSLMFQRLVQNYNEIVEHGKIQSDYPFTYVDFVHDDINYQDSNTFLEDKKFWTKEFSNLPDALIPLISEKKNESKRKEIYIKRAMYNQINELAGKHNASAFHIILGVLYIYFGRYYRSDDLSIGIPVLNRGKSSFKKTVGLFMGIAPLRLALDFDNSFQELILQIKNKLRQEYRHQRFPLGKLIQALNIFEETDRLFSITLSYEKQNYSNNFYGTKTTVIPLSHESERVPLAVYIREFDEEEDVKIDFDYNESYFTGYSIDEFAIHFENILHEVLLDSSQKIKDINYLSVQERAKIIKEFNNTTVSYPSETFVDVFLKNVKLFQDKIAVSDGDQELSYSQLDFESNKVATYILQNINSQKKRPIAVLLNRSANLVCVLLGVIKSGRPYIPLDPNFPKDRLEYIIENSKCESIIISEDLSVSFDFKNTKEFILEDIKDFRAEDYITALPAFNDTAYIIYTSGSTGNPKGVEIGHQSLINFLWSMQKEPGITSDDIFYAVTTYSFDISILELFLPIISGSVLRVVKSDVLSDLTKVISDIEHTKPTIVQATPSFFQMLFHAGWNGNKSLKILCGGDLLSETLAGKLISTCKEVWNMYGPTETTIWSSTKKIVQPRDAKNIGKPIDNTSFYILDQWRNTVSIGAIGDIYIGGDGHAKGYYLNAELTNERFPYIADYKERLYNTGDLGKWNDKGEIEFLGRNDFQVKIRGYRIELGEIEEKLVKIPNIDQAIVIAKKINDEAFLAAFVKTNDLFQEDLVTQILQKELPEYMVPKIIVRLEKFPLTPNNKIDRKALANQNITYRLDEAALPQTKTEEKLLALWLQNLPVNQVSITDNFFKLGGHSLNAVRIIYEINKLFGCSLSQKDIFVNPTIKSIGALIDNIISKGTTFYPISTAPEKEFYDLTHAQKNIWIASQRTEASIAYNMNAIYEIQGNLNISILNQALLQVIDKQESLRTNFFSLAGIPKQKIKPVGEVNFELKTIEVESEQFDAFSTSILYKEFELEKDLLLRLYHVVVDEFTQYLLFSTHHIIMDGWSVEIFIKELMVIYNQLSEGKEYEINPLPFQFKDYSEWINNQPLDENANAYWTKELKGYQIKDSFFKDLKHDEVSFNGNEVNFIIDANEKTELVKLAYTFNLSVYSILISLVGSFIHKYSNHKDICIGTVNSGRNSTELFPCIGMFVNTVPLRFMIKKEDTFKEVFNTINQKIINSFQFSGFPFTTLQNRNSPLFDVMIAYQNPDFSLTDISGFNAVEIKPFQYKHKVSRFPLTFNFYHDDDKLCCALEYNSDYYSLHNITIIIEKFKKIIQEIIKNPDDKLADYDILLQTEKELKQNIEINFNF
ncbi:non-ribosomal peptide synthetase [Flavobacterium soyae]|uniref:non-ribosomal peptide synthetase n=1 Tax=Flavobacterium soyae TaxID=2903098 RepID=UPI001E62B4CC|nr:non-ribosomal peptide synthetase [Flavobacterium soyae]MCD9574050.1 amino acid adenylation domain-containing protein [Flavobacterium soyae]